MRFVGLVGSARIWGNTEILTRNALEPLAKLRHEVSMVRLMDLRIESCTGCLACVLRGVRCPLNDDFYFLMEQMERADGIILGAPAYFMGAPGIVKLIVDRFLALQPEQFCGKKAVTFGVAAKAEWARLLPRQLNLLPLAAGFELVESDMFEAAGPGEVLLDSHCTNRAAKLGLALLSACEGRHRQPLRDESRCPICHGRSFELIGPARVECPLCYVQGDVVSRAEGGVAVRFADARAGFRYFGQRSLAQHIDEWVRLTGPRFSQHARDIKERRRVHEDSDISWSQPTS